MFRNAASRRRWWLIVISVATFCVVFAVAPWLYLSGLHVHSARLIPPGGSGARPPEGGPDRGVVRVEFSLPQDVAAFRRRWRFGYIEARLLDCADRSAEGLAEVITQGSEILPDAHRIRALGRTREDGQERFRYRGDFDNVLLRRQQNGESALLPAATTPGGLCLRLYGWKAPTGTVRSATVSLSLER